MEIKHKGRINKVVEEHEVTWPTNLQQEIVEGMKTAEKEVLKTMEAIGMIVKLQNEDPFDFNVLASNKAF